MLAKIEDGIIKVISEGVEETEALNKWLEENVPLIQGAQIAFAVDPERSIARGVRKLEDIG